MNASTFALGALALALLVPPVRADIVPRGQRSIPHRGVLHLGDLGKRCVGVVELERGESLEDRARKEGWSEAKLAAVRALNPERPKAWESRGSRRIALPPERTEGEALHVFAWPTYPFSAPYLVQHGDPLRGRGCRVLVVPHSKLAAFFAAHGESRMHPRKGFLPGIWVSPEISLSPYISMLSAVRARRTDVSVGLEKGAKPGEGLPALECRHQTTDLNSKGEPLGGSGPGSVAGGWTLSALSLLGLIAGGWLARRRRLG